MLIKISEKLMNKRGSSLAFVLIIGMVMMILVAALLVVANGEFTFTQETLESRQAYIDAKSVIEFGKIEINSRTTALNNINNDLTALYVQYKAEMEKTNPDTNLIRTLKTKIDAAEAQRTVLINALSSEFIIYGNTKNATGTLTSVRPVAPNDAELVKLGELKFDSVKNQFRIETDRANLSRQLDYKVDFNYVASTNTQTTIPGSLPSLPTEPTFTGTWTTGVIQKNPNTNNTVWSKFPALSLYNPMYENRLQELNLIAYPEANLKVTNVVTWVNGRLLEMQAHNICFAERFSPSESDSDHWPSNFYFTAVEKLDPTTKEKVPGDIYFLKDYEQVNHDLNTMTASGGNVVFKEDLIIRHDGSLRINCKNLFVDGDIVLTTDSPRLDIVADNIIVKGDIILDNDAILTVTGTSGNTSQMICGTIKPMTNHYNSVDVSINGLASFICTGFTLNGNSTLNLSSNAIQILKDQYNAEGNLSLNSLSGTNTIKTQYFICEGETRIVNDSPSNRILNIIPMDNSKAFNIRFVGRYTQQNAVVNVNNADNIYFDNGFTREHDGIINYPTNKTPPTNVYIGTNSSYKDGGWTPIPVAAGNYVAKGSIPGNYWLERKGDYSPPPWPSPPNTTGTTSVVVTTGEAGIKSDSEIYY